MGRAGTFCNFHISNNIMREFLAEYLGKNHCGNDDDHLSLTRDLHVGGLRYGSRGPVSPVSTQLRELPHSQLGVRYDGVG